MCAHFWTSKTEFSNRNACLVQFFEIWSCTNRFIFHKCVLSKMRWFRCDLAQNLVANVSKSPACWSKIYRRFEIWISNPKIAKWMVIFERIHIIFRHVNVCWLAPLFCLIKNACVILIILFLSSLHPRLKKSAILHSHLHSHSHWDVIGSNKTQ